MNPERFTFTQSFTDRKAKPKLNCIQCGDPIPLIWNRLAGRWMQRAHLLLQYDKEHQFCTVRCAVWFAVRAAKRPDMP